MTLFLLFISFVYLLVIIYQNRTIFTTKFNPTRAKQLYEQSQWQQSQNVSPLKVLDTWALQHKYTGWNNFVDENKSKLDTEKVKANIIQSIRNMGISDAELYSYVGYQYVNGANPTLLNPEHPPLGKYLIGISILVFHNENVILLMCGFVTLLLVFMIVYLYARNLLSASVAVLLTSTQTLFIDQLIHGPQLEIFQLMFLLFLLLLLQLYDRYRHSYLVVLAGIAFGCFLSVKTVSTHLPFFVILFMCLTLLSKKFRLKELIIVNLVGFLIFMATYFSYFLHGESIRKWLGVQKYIVMFYKQSGINIFAFAGNYLRLIFTGSWKFWSENTPVSHYSEWSIMWMIVFAVAMYFTIKTLTNKNRSFLEVFLALFIILYNGFLFIVPMFPRYLLILFIPMILLISIKTADFMRYEKKTI